MRHGPDEIAYWPEAFEIPDVVRPFASATIDRPNWHHYLAYDGDVAVGAAAMHVEDHVGWLGFGGTRPSHRGRGWQSALFARRIIDARALGATLLVTETGEETPGEPTPHTATCCGRGSGSATRGRTGSELAKVTPAAACVSGARTRQLRQKWLTS